MTVRDALDKAKRPGVALEQAIGEGRVSSVNILKAVGVDPANPTHQAMLLVAEKYDLDALLGHVMILPKGGKPYITRDGFLHIAHRSGDLDGIEVVEESESPTHYFAKVAVWRRSMSRPFAFTAKYPKAGQNREFAEEMALARATRRALKHAFDVADDIIAPPDAAAIEPYVATLAPEPVALDTSEAIPPEAASGSDYRDMPDPYKQAQAANGDDDG